MVIINLNCDEKIQKIKFINSVHDLENFKQFQIKMLSPGQHLLGSFRVLGDTNGQLVLIPQIGDIDLPIAVTHDLQVLSELDVPEMAADFERGIQADRLVQFGQRKEEGILQVGLSFSETLPRNVGKTAEIVAGFRF